MSEVNDETVAADPLTEERLRTLGEFLELYDQQARHGVFEGPRYQMSYSVVGEGPPLYIVQGMCSTRRLYAALSVELGKKFRVVLYDLPGVNDGDKADLKRYRIDDYPADLFALADHLGDQTFPVVGNSFGTTITVRAMLAEPSRIVRSVLAGGFAHRPLSFFEKVMVKIAGNWPGRMHRLPTTESITRYNHERELIIREAALVDFLLAESGHTPIRTTAQQASAVNQTDLREMAKQVSQPVLVFHGEQDRLVPPRHASELANCIPNVQIMLVPGCGHIPHLSHPELFAHVVERFCGTHCNGTESCSMQSECSLANSCQSPAECPTGTSPSCPQQQ